MSLWLKIFVYIFKPHTGETAEQYSVRMLLTAAIAANLLLFGGHFAYAYQHFADKDDVQFLKEDSLDGKITAWLDRECKNRQAGNNVALQYAITQKNLYLDQYRDLKGREKRVPTCEQMGYTDGHS